MDCNLEIHDEFKNMGEIICPFCEQTNIVDKEQKNIKKMKREMRKKK